jgi:hypothetical protein
LLVKSIPGKVEQKDSNGDWQWFIKLEEVSKDIQKERGKNSLKCVFFNQLEKFMCKQTHSLFYDLMLSMGAKGAVFGLRGAHNAGECALLKPEKCQLFLPSPMHACPRHDPRATS